MKSRLLLIFGLLFVGHLSAQNMKLDIQTPSFVRSSDSTIISFNLTVSMPEMDAKNCVRLTPVLMNNRRVVELQAIILNGKKAQGLYLRNLAMLKRQGKSGNTNTFAVIGFESMYENQSINYRSSLPAEDWISQSKLVVRKELINGRGVKIQSETVSVSSKNAVNAVSSIAEIQPVENVRPFAEPEVSNENVQAVSFGGKQFKGSYLSPESDATDERNQKELNFNLDEARVIANVQPEMLSLRELYTVALSYKANVPKFYQIIQMSVKIYPASPIANLNAAAAAIEQGDAQTAGRYLQMASHESVAYKNCRGAYELLCNNTYEGIRLLKAAQAEGSEEATQNLKLFFESNQQTQ